MVKFENVRLVMAITVANDMEIPQFDFKTAFLHGDIVETLHMEQPEGFVDPNHRFPIIFVLFKKHFMGLDWFPAIAITNSIRFFYSLASK